MFSAQTPSSDFPSLFEASFPLQQSPDPLVKQQGNDNKAPL
ncbi:MAG: hypothetical protein OJF47_003554 [Nitrospira sp.]|nr:MAG: hypothetical protein OJF47_003554 [Nitrospira sp.]